MRGSTYSAVLFAFCGVLASLPLLVVAMLPALAWQSAPEFVRVLSVLLIWVTLVGALGLVHPVRRALIVTARRLLQVSLPSPALGHRTPNLSEIDRWRAPLWIVLHVMVGWLAALATSVLFIMGISLPGNWLGGTARISLFDTSVDVTGGWTWSVAAGCLLLAVGICVLVATLLRWLAPRLLGPSTAERLALAEERELQLAERNRVAHELHDSIGHTLTAATLQAAVAGEGLASDPAAARAAMRSIEESTRAALEDLDYVLGVLREERPGAVPSRTLSDLPALIDRLRHAGAVVEVNLSGDLSQIQGTLSRAAYRILQEGTTNALRHGDSGPIEITVAVGSESVELRVVNSIGAVTGGKADVVRRSGRGLAGLAERVRLLNGEFKAGPDGAQGWRLSVQLPVRVAR